MEIATLMREFCDYSSYMRGYSPATIMRYKTFLNAMCAATGITQLEEANEDIIRRFFIEGRTKRGWQPNTFICYHKTLRVFFRWCREQGYMQADPTERIEVPKLEKRLPPKLSRQDAMRLLEVIYNYPYEYRFLRQRNHAIFATFLYAGLRRNELLHLKLTDVDLENMTIFIRQGKGAKDRIIPMSHTLTESLRHYLAERKRLKKTCPEFFTSLNRNTGFTATGMKRLVEKIRKASGIEFSVHKLRHTFATLMLEGGCDIYSLSRMLGHADIKTTTIYLAATAEHLRGQIAKHPLN